MNKSEQVELWRKAIKGDRSSLEDLLRSTQDVVFRFCMSQLRSEQLAIDATQETAMRVIQKLDSFRQDAKFSTWVLGYAYNVCRETLRKFDHQNQPDQLGELIVDKESESFAESRMIAFEENQRVQRAISNLPPRQREAVVLRYFESLSLAEVADVMKVSIGTIKATLNSAIKNLKTEMVESN